MARDTNSKVELEIRNSSSGNISDARVMSITVRDSASGQTIVEVPITADQFMAALAGSYHGRMPAWVVPPAYRARLGLKSLHKTVRLPSTITERDELDALAKSLAQPGDTSSGASYVPRSAIPAGSDLDAWVLNEMQYEGWTEAQFTRHNYGWGLHLTKYVDPDSVEPRDWERD